MLVKHQILSTLIDLNDKYEQAPASKPQDSIYFSKLAILEYCGWIEDAFDKIALRCVKNKLETPHYKQILNNSIIQNNHGFQYKKNVRPMLLKTVGIAQMEKFELSISDTGKLEILTSQLKDVLTDRNNAAHLASDTLQTYPAPSITINRLHIVYPILREMYSFAVNLP